MKAKFEHIQPSPGNSFLIRKFTENKPIWHYHPEYEIVYISSGSGRRHVGNHISQYQKGDLIFLGPNLPHYGFTYEMEEGQYEIVVQMRKDFPGEDFFEIPEMRFIKQLFHSGRTGLSFYGHTRRKVGRILTKAFESGPFEKLLFLLEALQTMATSEEFERLNATGYSLKVFKEDEYRLQHIYQFVQDHATELITNEIIAKEVSMTVPAFCRYFKKVTGQTFTQFVNAYRVSMACQLLRETDDLITDVAGQSGFNNLSNFNKHFLRVTGMTPSEYRKSAMKVVHLET